jgi:hypothetical protein
MKTARRVTAWQRSKEAKALCGNTIGVNVSVDINSFASRPQALDIHTTHFCLSVTLLHKEYRKQLIMTRRSRPFTFFEHCLSTRHANYILRQRQLCDHHS